MSAAAAELPGQLPGADQIPMAVVRIPTSVVDAVAAARTARDEGIAQAEASEVTGWNRALIDQAIEAFADSGRPFSANDLRHLLDVPGPLMGARFLAASNRGRIRFAGYVTSTKKNTHAKPVARWVGVPLPTEDES